MDKQRRAFISYSRASKDFALRLARELRAEGFPVWLDQLDIPLGARWDREVERALKECEIFMVIMTPTAIDSENVLDEIGYAIDHHKRIMPILLEQCEVPLRLSRIQYVDFTDKSFDEGVESAKELLRTLIDQLTTPRATPTEEEQKQPAQAEAFRKDEEERIAKAEAERREREETERLAALKAVEERTAKQKAEEERTAKVEAERREREEAERLAARKAEEERAAKAKAEAERKEKEEANRLAALKAAEERAAKQKAEQERIARAEEERLARQRAAAGYPAKTAASPSTKTNEKPGSYKTPLAFGVIGGIILVGGIVTFAVIAMMLINFWTNNNIPVTGQTETPAKMVEKQTIAVQSPVPTKPLSTRTAKPTSPAASHTPTAQSQDFFREEFGSNFDSSNWYRFTLGKGSNQDLVIQQEDDHLLFDLGDKNLYVYYTYTPYIYTNVSLTLNAENQGRNNNNVSLVCRMDNDATGWYEFSVESGGLWYLYAYSDGQYKTLSNGGTMALKQGRNVNEYRMDCVGSEITMYVNGSELGTVKDTTYGYKEGYVGFNISSLNVLPITVQANWFDIAEP